MFIASANTDPIPGISIALRPDAAVEVELAAGFVLTQVDAIVVLDSPESLNREALEWLATEQVSTTFAPSSALGADANPRPIGINDQCVGMPHPSSTVPSAPPRLRV